MSTTPGQQQGNPTNAMQRIERLQAWFNGLIALAAFLALGVGWYQLSAMRTQSELMAEQLKGARDAIKQTDKVIARMELDQRPWLAIGEVEIANIIAGQAPQCAFTIENSGNTPGTLTRLIVRLTPESIDNGGAENAIRTMNFAETHGVGDFIKQAQPPNGRSRQFVAKMPILTEQEAKDIDSGASIFCFIALTIYTDATDTIHRTEVCLTYNTKTKQFYTYKDYNRML